MLKMLVTAQMLGIDLVDRTREKLTTEPERGSFSLEQVVIAAALLTAAIALVGIIATAVTNRASSIT